MKIRGLVLAGAVAGAAALGIAGCTRVAEHDAEGQGRRGGRTASSAESPATAARGGGWGRQGLPDEPWELPSSPRANDPRAVDPASDRTGREVAETGELRSLSGKLAYDEGEWYLESSEGRFLLHLGNSTYVESTGMELEEGAAAAVRGIVDGEEVSVVSVDIGGASYALRADDGRPLWAGGAGRLSGEGRGAGRGGQGSADTSRPAPSGREGSQPRGGSGRGAGEGRGAGGGRGVGTRT